MPFRQFAFKVIWGLVLSLAMSCSKGPSGEKNVPGLNEANRISDGEASKRAGDQLLFEKAQKISDETEKIRELETIASSKSAFFEKAADKAVQIRISQIDKECREGEESSCAKMLEELTRRYPSHDSTPLAIQQLTNRHERDRFDLLLEAESILKERYEITREITHSKCHLLPEVFRDGSNSCPKGPSRKRQRANMKAWKALVKKMGDDPVVKELKERWNDAKFNEHYKRKYKVEQEDRGSKKKK